MLKCLKKSNPEKEKVMTENPEDKIIKLFRESSGALLIEDPSLEILNSTKAALTSEGYTIKVACLPQTSVDSSARLENVTYCVVDPLNVLDEPAKMKEFVSEKIFVPNPNSEMFFYHNFVKITCSVISYVKSFCEPNERTLEHVCELISEGSQSYEQKLEKIRALDPDHYSLAMYDSVYRIEENLKNTIYLSTHLKLADFLSATMPSYVVWNPFGEGILEKEGKTALFTRFLFSRAEAPMIKQNQAAAYR